MSPLDTLQIDVLWTMRDLRNPRESWGLYVNHVPMYASKALRDAFYDSTRPDLRLVEYADMLGGVEALVREVRALVPEIAPIVEGGIRIQPEGEVWALTHYPTGVWQGTTFDSGLIQWTRPLFLGGKVFPPGTDSGNVRLMDLSPAAVAAVKLLDGRAIETAYRRHAEDLEHARGLSAEKLPPPRKIRAFIAYRRTHFVAAKGLHEILFRMAHNTLFDPYLDHHHMRSGEWMPQLMQKIENADVFMPLVSQDYAARGTVGRTEYEKATEVAANRHISDFFAPILIAKPSSDVAEVLHTFDGVEIGSEAEVNEDTSALVHFLGRVAASVLSRSASRP